MLAAMRIKIQLAVSFVILGMPFTELYCRAVDGSNLNSGSTNTAAASLTYASGSWVSATRVFTVASGNPATDGIAIDDLVSVYADGSTVTGFVGFVTARTATAITVHATRSSGTSPVDGTSNRTLKKGGAWKGPNAAVGFPFNIVAGVMTDASGLTPRVTMIGTFNITAAMTHTIAGPVRFQGATAVAGDGGRATIDGGTSGTYYVPLTVTGANNSWADLVFQNNGASGSAANGVVINAAENLVRNCVFRNVARGGLTFAAGNCTAVEVEAHGCNQGNVAGLAGLYAQAAGTLWVRCISHDNLGSNSSGFYDLAGGTTYINCIADTNGQKGFGGGGSGISNFLNCDAYNNVSDGIVLGNSSAACFYIENCNLVRNGGWGINGSGAGSRVGVIRNCAFGAGTEINTSGAINGLSAMEEIGSVAYAANITPWVDPANGDFRINLAAAKGTGRGAFLQVAPGYAGTVGYPDIGAAQHQETEGGGRSPLAKTIIIVQ